MQLLLDTHIFLWWNSKDVRLAEAYRAAIELPKNDVFVSAVSVWEIAIKRSTGKLMFNGSASDAVIRHNFRPLSITLEHVEMAGALPDMHRDPFDRLLVAQAQLEALVLVTVDEQILRYPVARL
jgi:PIN domain nuclease of toxin-antitoxin system